MKKQLFVRDRQFYKTYFSLAGTITLQALIALAVNLADNIMLGRYSEAALSGATMVNQIHFLLQMVVIAVGTGVVIMASQYWGRGETEPIRALFAIGLKLGLAVGILFTAAGLLFPRQLVSLLTDKAAVIEQGTEYLKIVAWTFLVFSLSQTLLTSLRSIEATKVGPVMSLIALVVNVFLNYVLIFGHLGAAPMGIRGAALATLAGRIVELVVLGVYLFCFDKKLRLRPRDLLGLDRRYLKKYIRLVLPPMGSGVLWGVSMAAQTAILGHLSEAAIAANSVSGTIYQVVAQISNSAANAASVVIGMTIGQRKLDRIRPYTRTLQMIFLGCGLAACGLLLALRGPVLALYRLTPETAALTNTFLLVLSVTTIGSCYQFPCAGGIVQGGGDTRYLFVVDTVFMWLYAIPLAYLSAFVFQWPYVVTFLILKSDQLLKCIPNGIRTNRYKWVRVLTD